MLVSIKEKLDQASERHSKRLNEAPAGMDYHEFEAYMAETGDEVDELSRQYRLIKTPSVQPLRDIGHHMTLAEFIECCESGGFIDYDGSGNYARENVESNVSIYPSDVTNKMVRTDFSHVVWYNR